jgi:hypothetical protein
VAVAAAMAELLTTSVQANPEASAMPTWRAVRCRFVANPMPRSTLEMRMRGRSIDSTRAVQTASERYANVVDAEHGAF